MKKKVGTAVVLFLIVFAAVYCICSFCIPGWKVKLEADTMTVLIENLKILWPMKALISIVAGAIIGSVPFWLLKKKIKEN